MQKLSIAIGYVVGATVVFAQTYTISTIAGGPPVPPFGNCGAATGVSLNHPYSVAVDQSDNLYIADFLNSRVVMVSSSGVVSTVAGNGKVGFSGDGGPATAASLACPQGVALDNAGNLLIADWGNSRVRKVDRAGLISTIAGNGLGDFGSNVNPNPAPATSTAVAPVGLATDAQGNVYVSEDGLTVRRISAAGIISNYAGVNTALGFSGDGGPATSATLNYAWGLAVDGQGNLFIADDENSRIRRVSADGIITTFAGNGTYSYAGDGGAATSAGLHRPDGVAVDSAGNVFIADTYNHCIRRVATDGIITTIAGTGVAGHTGDGGIATQAELYYPLSLTVDRAGNVYVAEPDSNDVRLLQPLKQPVVNAVYDAASETASPVSPGKIVVLYGTGLGGAVTVNPPESGKVGTQSGGTAVVFNGIPAPVIYASASQVSAIAPYELAGLTGASVTVSYGGQTSAPIAVTVAASAPAFFTSDNTGAGQIAAVNPDGSINGVGKPVHIGDYISLYATGEGQTSPGGVDGELAVSLPYPHPVLPVEVTVDGVTATVVYAGAAPTEVAGLMQVVIQVPSGISTGGSVPVNLKVGGISNSNSTSTIAVVAQ